MLEGEIQDIETPPAREKAAAPKPIITGALAPDAPAPGWKGGSPYAPIPSAPDAPAISSSARPVAPVAPVALDGPVAGINALAALRQDLKAGGVKKTAEATTAIRESRQSAALFAASAYGSRLQAGETRKTEDEKDAPREAPPGAVAAAGGWFSDSMLSAYGKYQNSTNLTGPERPVAVDMTR